MNNRFTSVVDPIFLRALQVLERLDQGGIIDAPELHREFQEQFEFGDAVLGDESEWRLAKYALVAWIDEMLIGHAWSGSKWWSNNALEAQLFQTRLCSVRFFELAKEAATVYQRDALHVFYHCVILGFRGMYGTSGEPLELAINSGLPPTLPEWLKSIDRMLVHSHQRSGSPPVVMSTIAGAAPHNGRLRVVGWSLAAALLLVINLVVYRV